MGIVTNHGMPVRWSTAHYRFSRAPCTATLYRRPSLARSFTSFCLCSSQSTSLALSSEFPSLFHQLPFLHVFSLTLCHGHSFPFVWLSLLTRAYSSSGVLRPNGEIGAVLYPSLSLVYHPSSGTITELSRSVYYRCCPPLPPPMFPPTIALSPSDSVSLHLSTIFVLSLPIRSILSLCLTILFLSAPYRAFQ